MIACQLVLKKDSQIIKQNANKNIYENHNRLMNSILLSTEKDLHKISKEILTHFLSLAQVKNCRQIVIGLITKFIEFLKYYQKYIESRSSSRLQSKPNQKIVAKIQEQTNSSTKNQNISQQQNSKNLDYSLDIYQIHYAQMPQLLLNIINIILLIQIKSKASQTETLLRIIQTTFSLIDYQFVKFMPYSLLTKIYSIAFDCCSGGPILQNISVSCLFSLTETIFSHSKQIQNTYLILQNFLQYLFKSKKFSWIKDGDLNGLIWDLVVTGIKSMENSFVCTFAARQSNVQLLNIMYKVAAQKAFSNKFHSSKTSIANSKSHSSKAKNSENSINFKQHDEISQFIRCYKAFIILSIQCSLIPLREGKQQQIVPFKNNIKLFQIVFDFERNFKMYIMLEGIFMLIDKYPEFPINEEKGYILLEIVSKIAEQLCLCNQKIDCTWANEKSFMNKFYFGDFQNINDGDFVKIIRNSIIQLRKKYQSLKANDSYLNQKQNITIINEMVSERSGVTQNKPSPNSPANLKKRWEKFIKCIIKVIRYLSSISILSETDEQPVRKIILQFQHWFLICPLNKIKNLILQQLLITTSQLKSKSQAIKVSQCIQIGSNLIYGYYDMLDSIGLTIIMKMMAGIKAERQQGKQYQELEEIFNMSERLYLEQKIVKNQTQFLLTIQAFVQCANSLLADLEQPNTSIKATVGKHPSQRYYKMIEYILEKLNIVILQNGEYLFGEWNFLTGFWMSFCSNKNVEIQIKTITYVGYAIQKLLEIYKDKQEQIISIYHELSLKCAMTKNVKIQYQIISQIKNFIPLLEQEIALMEIFKIIKILQAQIKNNELTKLQLQNAQKVSQQKKLILELNELQEAFIKQGIFRIKKLSLLTTILQGILVLGKQKNEQYKILTLLWNVADHLRNLSSNYAIESQNNKFSQEYQQVWKLLFQKISLISTESPNAQTKQSSIHTFTQIVAENSLIVEKQLLVQLYETIFVEKLFVSLMKCHNHSYSHLEISCKVQMLKTAAKNFLKLTKKFISQKLFDDIRKQIDLTLTYLTKQFEDAKDKEQIIPIELMYQYLVFVQKLINKQSIEGVFVNQTLVDTILNQIWSLCQKVDKSTILWRKKFQPHFNQVRNIYKTTFLQVQPISQKDQVNVEISKEPETVEK